MAADAIQTDVIARVVPLFAEHQDSDDDTLLDAIVALGFDRKQAIALLDFMPIAFFHVVADGKIANMPDHYVRYSADQKPIGNVLFVDEPIYVAARHYAENEYETDGRDPVSMRSAEIQRNERIAAQGNANGEDSTGPISYRGLRARRSLERASTLVAVLVTRAIAMQCIRSTAYKFSQAGGRLSAPGDGGRSSNPKSRRKHAGFY